MLFSDAMGRKIVSTTTADTVGKVAEFIVDPSQHAIAGLKVKKADQGEALRWSDIRAFGVDAVTVDAADRITEPDEQLVALGGKDRRIMGKRVLSAHGDELGTVADVEFDPATGVVTALRLQDEEVEGVRLLGIGSYAVVVEPID